MVSGPDYDLCSICDLPIVTGGCEHTAAERKKYEEDMAWQDYDWEDPSWDRIQAESLQYDKLEGRWSRTYKDDD